MIEKALAKLNNLKNNINVDEVFDLEKWATYFAIIDLSNGKHAAISKSVKLHYNTVTSKFEPIGFDAQIENEQNTDFLFLDFLNPNNKKCGAYCYDREWFLKFLKTKDGKLNYKFINLYLKNLEKLSSDKFLSNFSNKYSKKINFLILKFTVKIQKKPKDCTKV